MSKYKDLVLEGSMTVNLGKNVKLGDLLSITEKEIIKMVINKCKRNQSICAKALGINRGTLRTKLRKHFGNEYFRGIK
jgi:DNA-binding protein Fis